jgi:hypothetical protein
MQPHEKGFFTEEDSVEVVTGRNAKAKDERLKHAMAVITRKLHEAVKEIQPTQDEWLETIQFLTRSVVISLRRCSAMSPRKSGLTSGAISNRRS